MTIEFVFHVDRIGDVSEVELQELFGGLVVDLEGVYLRGQDTIEDVLRCSSTRIGLQFAVHDVSNYRLVVRPL